MNPTMTDERVTKALIDPASVFSNPGAVVADESLSIERKIEIVSVPTDGGRQWERPQRTQQADPGDTCHRLKLLRLKRFPQ